MGPVVAPALETIEAIVPAVVALTTSVATRRPATGDRCRADGDEGSGLQLGRRRRDDTVDRGRGGDAKRVRRAVGDAQGQRLAAERGDGPGQGRAPVPAWAFGVRFLAFGLVLGRYPNAKRQTPRWVPPLPRAPRRRTDT